MAVRRPKNSQEASNDKTNEKINEKIIVATYGPDKKNRIENKDQGIKETLCSQLGYEPLWVIYAGNVREFWLNSLLSIPTCPSVCYIYEVPMGDIQCIDKVGWDKYLNSGGKTDLPEIKPALNIPRMHMYKYELMIPPKEYRCIASLNINQWSGDKIDEDELEGFERAFFRRVITETRSQAKEEYNEYGLGKTLEQYVESRVAFTKRSLFLATDAVEWYLEKTHVGGMRDFFAVPIDYVYNYYDGLYKLYDMMPSEEMLENIKREMSEYF